AIQGVTQWCMANDSWLARPHPPPVSRAIGMAVVEQLRHCGPDDLSRALSDSDDRYLSCGFREQGGPSPRMGPGPVGALTDFAQPGAVRGSLEPHQSLAGAPDQ